MSTKFSFDALSAPFSPNEVKWRAGATNQEKSMALAVPYLPANTIQDRLDQVCGPENWHNLYAPGPDGGVVCGISIRCGDEWITKWDGADGTNIDPVKGGLTDSFKRAAAVWGIGRYLKRLPPTWWKCEPSGKSVRLVGTPKLPAWALPAGFAYTPAPDPATTKPAMPAVTIQPPAEHKSLGQVRAENKRQREGLNAMAEVLSGEVKLPAGLNIPLHAAKNHLSENGRPFSELSTPQLSQQLSALLKTPPVDRTDPAFFDTEAIRTILYYRNHPGEAV